MHENKQQKFKVTPIPTKRNYSKISKIQAKTPASATLLANPKFILRKYWSVLKTRLKKESRELATNCSQLIMPIKMKL